MNEIRFENFNNKKVIKFFVFVLVVLTCTFSAVFIVKRQLDTTENLKSNRVISDQIKKLFYDKYAFDIQKDSQDYHIAFGGISDGVISFIDSFNSLKLDFTQIEDAYTKLGNYPVYKVNEPISGTFTTKEINTFDNTDSLLRSITSELQFNFLERNDDSEIPVKDIPYNEYIADITRTFYLKLDEGYVMNLGAILSGSIHKSGQIEYITLNQNISSNLTFEKISNISKLEQEGFFELLNSKLGRMYEFGELGLDYSSENPNLEEFGYTKNTIIKLDKISVNYVFLKEIGIAAPILRLEGIAEGKDVAFWVWFAN